MIALFRSCRLQQPISFELNHPLVEENRHCIILFSKEIDDLAKEMGEYRFSNRSPVSEKKILAAIISKIEKINRFCHLKKLVAFAGIDPEIYESDRFKEKVNYVTKIGSSRLRHALYMAARCRLGIFRKPSLLVIRDIVGLQNSTPEKGRPYRFEFSSDFKSGK
ncbi:transposase [Peribacillus deserti]|uniref:Transposase IS116/IS110/IS902 C-terminal domain-containing protein n=1 Tax=Peribacillus deserti TaxID=673318 RepID=A0A2N5M9U1_9BACI|nr:hypothetical protein CUU66_04015 [Peribacillus deserti]